MLAGHSVSKNTGVQAEIKTSDILQIRESGELKSGENLQVKRGSCLRGLHITNNNLPACQNQI